MEKTITSILGDDFGWLFPAILVAPFFVPGIMPVYAGHSCGTKTCLMPSIPNTLSDESKHGHIKFNHTIYLYIIINIYEIWILIYVMISGSVIHGHYICPTDWVHQRSRGSPTTFWSTTVPSSDTNSSTPRLGRGWPGARLGPAWPGSKHVKTLVQPGEPQKCGVNINIYIYTWVYKWLYMVGI